MSDILVLLDRILPNPYQTRLPRPADDDHVQALAADIKAHGLLQVPLGRLVDAAAGQPLANPPLLEDDQWLLVQNGGALVQLAFGHHRLAAYKLLAGADSGNGWQTMPVRIAALDDQQMALAAWSENAQRKDLSAWERYLALRRLADDFGWSQEQIGEHVGLARATVANIMRLGRLPENLQKKLHRGELSERAALAILPAYELPPAVLAQIAAKRQGGNDWTIRQLDEVLAHPEKKSAEARTVIHDVVNHVTQPLSTAKESEWGRGGFPVDQELAGVAAPACLECPQRLQETRCADAVCFAQKQAVFERAELAFASAATGLPPITNAELQRLPGGAKKHFEASDKAGLPRALAGPCPNLRLRYEREEPRAYDLRVPDYPHAGYVCVRATVDGLCECADGARAKREAKEKEAEERRQKEAAKLREKTIKELARDLRNQDLGAWHAVLWGLRSYSYRNHGNADKVAQMDANTTLENIARAVLSDALRWDNPSPHGCAADLAAWREKVGWGVVIPGQPGATAPEASDA